MYLFCLALMVVVLILLIFFVVCISVKACSFLDALAKKSELTEYESGFDFSGFGKLRKQNRTRNTIRSKLKKRFERIERQGNV